jgi:ParB/RepB/Spo0J family partition protein
MFPAMIDREYRELALSLIDGPQVDARMDRDEDKLEELAHDIARRGLIFPLAVVRVDGRYEVVDGERRHLACNRIGLASVPCFIYPTKSAALEGVKYAANAFREDMSPAEEATFFHHLFEHECGQDIDAVCALVNKKRPYVDTRLQLVIGDDEVFRAVRERTIGLGVAGELNKLPDEGWRRYYLLHAIKSGATVGVVQAWVTDWKNTHSDQPAAPASTSTSDASPIAASTYDPMRCYVCQKSNQYVPQQISVHAHCLLAVLDQLLAAYRGEQAGE